MKIKRASNWFYLIPGITEELQSPTQETVGREPETIGREPETTGMEPETAGSEPNNNELTIQRGKKRILRDQAGDEGSDNSTSGTSQVSVTPF